MTEERRQILEEKLNEAEASGDDVKIAAIKRTMEREYRECTSHTADRLKKVEETVNEIKDGLIPATMFDELKDGLTSVGKTVTGLKVEMEAWKNKAEGAKLLWTILGYIATAGGSGLIVKLLMAAGKASQTPGIGQ